MAVFCVTCICFFFHVFLCVLVLKHLRKTGTNFVTFPTVLRPFLCILLHHHHHHLGSKAWLKPWPPQEAESPLRDSVMRGNVGKEMTEYRGCYLMWEVLAILQTNDDKYCPEPACQTQLFGKSMVHVTCTHHMCYCAMQSLVEISCRTVIPSVQE